MLEEKLKQKLHELGIAEPMLNACRLEPCKDAVDLVEAGNDIFGRPQQMTAATLQAWQKMQTAAQNDGIELNLVSAYRSREYQCDLIQKKLERGELIENILKVSAIPGYSEHHTGCALDLHSGDGPPLEECFENHEAFSWLCEHAGEFGFHLSYPRNNVFGISYEPWHWCYHPSPSG